MPSRVLCEDEQREDLIPNHAEPLGGGVGKTHLIVAVGTKLVQPGYCVRFLMAQQVANAVLTATKRADLAR